MIPPPFRKSRFSAASKVITPGVLAIPFALFYLMELMDWPVSLTRVKLPGLGAAPNIMASIADLPLTPSISSHLINPAFNN